MLFFLIESNTIIAVTVQVFLQEIEIKSHANSYLQIINNDLTNVGSIHFQSTYEMLFQELGQN